MFIYSSSIFRNCRVELVLNHLYNVVPVFNFLLGRRRSRKENRVFGKYVVAWFVFIGLTDVNN